MTKGFERLNQVQADLDLAGTHHEPIQDVLFISNAQLYTTSPAAHLDEESMEFH